MNVHSVLIKPASGSCNMRCRYCFYADEMEHREQSSYGIMSEETLEILVRKVLESCGGPYHFAFQGGEPTLAGLDFYRSLIRFVNKYKKDGACRILCHTNQRPCHRRGMGRIFIETSFSGRSLP